MGMDCGSIPTFLVTSESANTVASNVSGLQQTMMMYLLISCHNVFASLALFSFNFMEDGALQLLLVAT